MITQSTNGATPSAGSIEAATQAFTSLLSGDDDQDTREQNAEAPQDDEPSERDPETAAEESSEEDQEAAEGEESEESEGEESDDESAEGEEPEGGKDQDPVYTVKADGQEIEVPLSELLKGYSREASFTRKSQELATERRTFEAEAQQTRVSRDQYAQGLEQLDTLLKSLQPQEPDWATLRATDPIEFGAQWAEHQQRLETQRQVRAERSAVMEQQQQEAEAVRQRHLAEGRNWLSTVIPEWADAEAAKTDRAAMKAYGQKMGFSPEELQQVEDPRAVVLIRKAMLFDRLQAKRVAISGKPAGTAASTSAKPGPKSPVMKPGAGKSVSTKHTSDLSRAKQRLAKTGTVRDAASVFKTLL